MASDKKSSFLFITYAYPPFKAVGSFRSYYLAEELVNKGYDVKVSTTKNYKFLDRQELPIDNRIKVKRLISFDYNFIKGLLGNKKKNTTTQKKQSTKENISKRIIDTFPFNIIYGLGGLIYILHSLFYNIPRLKNTTHIYSSFRPYSDHFIAFVLKTLKPSLYWHADFRDIHVDEYKLNVISVRYQKRINKFLFKKANVITSVSNSYLKNLKTYNMNHHLLPNGYNRMMEDRFNKSEVESFSKFRISHAGSLYNGRRDPRFLFGIIQELIKDNRIDQNDLMLSYAGSDGALWLKLLKEYDLDSCCQDLGSINHSDSVKLQKSSNVNLMITWATKNGGTFPAKFFEYLIARQPILTIINGEEDKEFDFIFDKYRIGNLVYNKEEDKASLKNFIQSEYKSWETKIRNTQYDFEEILTEYNWSNLIDRFLELNKIKE